MSENIQYVHYSFKYGENNLVVAYKGATAIAAQFVHRHADPRTGVMIRKNEQVKTVAYIRITPQELLVRLDGAIHVDSNIFDSLWQRAERDVEIAYAHGNLTHWYHREESKITTLATWALVLEHEPSRPEPAPVVVVAKPKRVKKVVAPRIPEIA
jgi:hypothetical protein